MAKNNKTVKDLQRDEDKHMAAAYAGAKVDGKILPPIDQYPESANRSHRIVQQLSNERRGIQGDVLKAFQYPGNGEEPYGKAYPAAIFTYGGETFMAMRADRPGYLDSVFALMTATKASTAFNHMSAADYYTLQYPIDMEGTPISYHEASEEIASGRHVYYERIVKLA